MQSNSTPHGWVDTLISMLAGGTLIGSLVALWNLVANRKKPAADIHESRARTRKTLAEARVSTDDYLDRIQTKHAKAVFDALKLKEERDVLKAMLEDAEKREVDLIAQSRSQQAQIRKQYEQIGEQAEEIKRLERKR